MRRTLLSALLMLGTLAGFVQGATLASFTDTAASSSNTFATGVIDLSTTPAATVTDLTFTNMIPGDTVTALLIVTNSQAAADGGLPLTYNFSVTATNALASALTLQIRDNGSTCNNREFITGGTTTHYGPVTGLAATNLLSTAHTVNAGSSENLCFQITFPPTTSTSLQSATTAATLTFSASAA